MKNIIFSLFLSFSLSHASGIYDGISFDDYEENGSLYFVNFYPYQSILDLGISTTNASTIILSRPISDIQTLSDLSGIDAFDMQRIREQSHLIDWDHYTDDLGMTIPQTNFLYGLSGLLGGVLFVLGFVLILTRRSS